MSNDFRIGEKAVYPAHGVAEVIGIEKKEINTTVCSFYVLKVLATGMQILVPKDKADQVGLRPVATASEIEEERRLLYVAMTRPTQRLRLIAAKWSQPIPA